MASGPHVFGDNRIGIWIIPNANLTDKLKHVLPRLRNAVPNLTDVFLPPETTIAQKDQCRQANFFTHTYDVAHGTPAADLAKAMLAKRRILGTGAIEVDLEGAAVQPDLPALAQYATDFVATVRKTNPNLPVRLNVPPFKGYALPVGLIQTDPQLYVIAQAYHGNQNGRLSEADVLLDLLDYGVPREKASVMYGVLNEDPREEPLPGRVVSLPSFNYKLLRRGSIYQDDLLLDAGLL